MLLALAVAPFIIAVLEAGQPPAAASSGTLAGTQARYKPLMDEREGTIAARQNSGCDLFWLRLSPSGKPDLQAREVVSKRPTGSYSPLYPVSHEAEDEPQRRGWTTWMRRTATAASELLWEAFTLGSRQDYGARFGARRVGLGLY